MNESQLNPAELNKLDTNPDVKFHSCEPLKKKKKLILSERKHINVCLGLGQMKHCWKEVYVTFRG